MQEDPEVRLQRAAHPEVHPARRRQRPLAALPRQAEDHGRARHRAQRRRVHLPHARLPADCLHRVVHARASRQRGARRGDLHLRGGEDHQSHRRPEPRQDGLRARARRKRAARRRGRAFAPRRALRRALARQEALPDGGRRRCGDRALAAPQRVGADAVRHGELVREGVRRGVRDHPVHPCGERRLGPHLCRHRAARGTHGGQEDIRHRRAQRDTRAGQDRRHGRQQHHFSAPRPHEHDPTRHRDRCDDHEDRRHRPDALIKPSTRMQYSAPFQGGKSEKKLVFLCWYNKVQKGKLID